MEKLVTHNRKIIIRGASGKLGHLANDLLRKSGVETVTIDRKSNLAEIEIGRNDMILDFSGPNPKNENFWNNFSLSDHSNQLENFLKWVGANRASYFRIGSILESLTNIDKYVETSQALSSITEELLPILGISGGLIFAANIYGSPSLKNFLDTVLEKSRSNESQVLLTPERKLNLINIEQFVNILLAEIFKSREIGKLEKIMILSESSISVAEIATYVRKQREDFKLERKLESHDLEEVHPELQNFLNVKRLILPNTVKKYIDDLIRI